MVIWSYKKKNDNFPANEPKDMEYYNIADKEF